MDSNKLRRLAGIPIDLSNPANAKTTVRTPNKLLSEAAKVPQHRGELAPKTKDNMRARVNHAKKALEALELARDELMDLPAIDYMEDVPTIIKQLHQMLHGEDGTGGVHHLHRHYKHEFDNTVFPEDIEEEKRKEEEDAQAQDAGVTGDEPEAGKKKKKTNENFDAEAIKKNASNPAPSEEGKSDNLGLEKQKVDPAKENKKPFKLAPDSDTKTMYDETKDKASVIADAGKAKGEHVSEDTQPEEKADKGKAKIEKPKAVDAKHGEDPEQDKEAIEDNDGESVNEANGTPLFARDAAHPKHDDEEKYSSWTMSTKPVNVVTNDEPSLYYPNGAKNESPNQLATNPYNENQKVRVPPAIKTALKESADEARKLAETFNMRKDWDSKNFHETLANAFETLVNFLNKETVYGIKEAQVFMTSLMSPLMNKIPPQVVKYIAAGGTLRSLKSYVNDVKAPHTGTVFQQDSDGTK